MSIVMKVSKATHNVLTTGNENLEFSSELATHSIHSITSYNFTVGATTEADVVTHNLGYVPKVWVYYAATSGSTYRKRIPVVTADGAGYDYYITTTKVHIKRSAFGSSYYKIIIFTRSPLP